MPRVRLPLLIPALAEELRLDELLERLDGLLFTGSPSNVEPHHYEGAPSAPGTLHDPAPRCDHAAADPQGGDGRRAGARHLPRLSGDERRLRRHLHQQVHEVAGHLDHRDDETSRSRCSTARRTRCILEPGGLLRSLAEPIASRVNSLHWQGIERLGPGPRGRGARARRPDRGFQSRGRGAVCARGAVASRVAGDGQPVFARAVCGLRRGVPRARRVQVKGSPMVSEIRSSSATTASPRSRPSFRTWPALRAARSCRRRNSPRTAACACRRASSCRRSPATIRPRPARP